MDQPTLPLLLTILLLFFSTTTTTTTNTTAAASPVPTSSQHSSLDPKQLTALQSIGIPTTPDPCSPLRLNLTTCDSSSPFRHLLSLHLSDCSPDLSLSPTALRSLSSSLSSLSLSNCPFPPFPPSHLHLLSFSFSLSPHRLSSLFLSRLRNLTHLEILHAPIAASAPIAFLSQMPRLLSATLSDANLSGGVPHHWHSLNLTHLDFSFNRLRGPLPTSINLLSDLQFLNLSSNSLSGPLPDSLGDLLFLQSASFSNNSFSGPIPSSMSALPQLTHLDLGSNQFNGTVPQFLAKMRSLKYLNLGDNNFHGVIPFNLSFIRRLEVFRVEGNSNLCYNRSVLSSKLRLGIAACDKYGMPLSPPPDRSTKADSSDYSGEDDGEEDGDGEKGGGGHHGPNKLVLGVAIGLSCLVFLVIFLVCLSKVCG